MRRQETQWDLRVVQLVASNTVLYSGGAWFIFRSVVVFLSHPSQMFGQYTKTGHCCFLSCSFPPKFNPIKFIQSRPLQLQNIPFKSEAKKCFQSLSAYSDPLSHLYFLPICRARWLREIGLVGREYKRWFYQKPKCDSNSQGFVSVRIQDFYPVLFILWFGIISSVGIFVAKILYNTVGGVKCWSRIHHGLGPTSKRKYLRWVNSYLIQLKIFQFIESVFRRLIHTFLRKLVCSSDCE